MRGANDNTRYDERLNGYPLRKDVGFSMYPLPVLDPDVAVELRRRCIATVADTPASPASPGHTR